MSFKPATYQEALAKKQQKQMVKNTKEWGVPSLGKVLTLTRPTRLKTAPKRIKKKKLRSISLLKKDLWEVIKIYIRERDQSICFTSGIKVEGSNRHVGHGVPSSVGGALLRYHPLNLHIQSYNENINRSGNGGEYYRRQLVKYGQDTMDKLYELKNHSIQADRYFYTSMIELYKQGNQEDIILFLDSYL